MSERERPKGPMLGHERHAGLVEKAKPMLGEEQSEDLVNMLKPRNAVRLRGAASLGLGDTIPPPPPKKQDERHG